MKRICLISTFAIATMGLGATAAMADVHFDISPQLVNGQIVTNGVTHSSTENPWTGEAAAAAKYYQPAMRVYGYELGEDPLFPTETNDPGINNEAGTYVLESGSTISLTGTDLPLGSVLSFTILSDLQYWNGAGFEAVPDAESLTITYGSTREAGAGTGVLSPLPVKTFTSSSTIHLHLEAELLGNGGTFTDPLAGIYMFQARLDSSDASVASSLPIWIVYNFGMDEDDHEAAIDYVNANLVPEPASLMLLGLGGVALLRRRRA